MRIERGRASEYMSYPVGQIVGDMRQETTVRQIVFSMLDEFISSCERVNTLLHSE